jgi:hypothetical protein
MELQESPRPHFWFASLTPPEQSLNGDVGSVGLLAELAEKTLNFFVGQFMHGHDMAQPGRLLCLDNIGPRRCLCSAS